ncbi:ZmpA/ZmpB/ZmpC family metallo-endopeptidase-related protein, partial [Clostridium sp.]|uniref:ZmpA/ZmpB/ZmpC family metallo-endopeptidase-related protein n=1 Tax=Clostridium sp. TaxID=1506 RepID=UPI003F2B0574
NDLFNEDFYRDILGWDTTNVWDVSNVQNGELPTLKSALDNNNNITLESNISTSEELIEKLSSNPFGNYKLTENIDLNSYKDGESVITTEFLGSLNGNEKTITGLNSPLFKKVNNATIENLIINGAYIDKAEENVGILSKQGSNSKISNVSITNSTVIGLKKVGGLFGYDNGSTIKQVSFSGDVKSTNGFVGGLLGVKERGQVSNSYAIGTLEGHGDRVGGFVGQGNNGIVVQNCFTKVNVNHIGGGMAGGFVGSSWSGATSRYENNISLGDITNGRKFDGESHLPTITANNINSYEYESSLGTSNNTVDNIALNGKINIATREMVTNPSFYLDILGWDTTNVWDVTKVSLGEIPTLKSNLDNSNEGSIISFEISNLDDNKETIINDIKEENGSRDIIEEDLQLEDGVNSEEEKDKGEDNEIKLDDEKVDESIDETMNGGIDENLEESINGII